MWEKLGFNGGTALVILITAYFIIKNAVKNGTIAAYKEIEVCKKLKTETIIENMASSIEDSKENE